MELLGMMPVDAFALRFHALPAAAVAFGSLWAWLAAALAAAVGLWRIRASGSSKSDVHSTLSPLPPPSSSPPVIAVPPARAAPTSTSPARPEPPSELSTPPKVRFTAYYGVDCDEDDVKNGTDRDEVISDGDVTVMNRMAVRLTARWEEREMAIRRKGDLGWYCYQDITALNGSVVRLWDGELAAAVASPRRRRRARWEFHSSI